jgi:DNA-binding NarL/FixJ family response regulator
MDIGSILIVDDHELLRVGLRSALVSKDLKPQQVFEASSLADAIDVYSKHEDSISLVVLDLNLPDSKGLSALKIFKRLYPSSRVLVLSGASMDISIYEQARTLGAARFLYKASGLEEIAEALRDTLQPGGEAAAMQDATPPVAPPKANRGGLSPREVEILDLVLQGRSNQEIIDVTHLKMGTVKNYISGLLIVFGVNSRSKLIDLFR